MMNVISDHNCNQHTMVKKTNDNEGWCQCWGQKQAMPNNFLSSYGCQPVSLSCQTYQFSWQYKNKSSYNCSWKWAMFFFSCYFHVKWFLASTSTAVFFQVNSVAHSYQPFTFKFVQPLELNRPTNEKLFSVKTEFILPSHSSDTKKIETPKWINGMEHSFTVDTLNT